MDDEYPKDCRDIDMNGNVNNDYQHCTVCTGDKTGPNVWYVKGVCKLDQLTYSQVYMVLQRIPSAKADLLKITKDPYLVALANDSKLVSDDLDSDKIAADLINKGDPSGRGANTLPYYTLIGGNTDGSIRGRRGPT